jgi:hypothetical protein
MKPGRSKVGLIVLMLLIPMLSRAQVDAGLLGGLNFSDARIKDNLGNEMEATGQTEFGVGILAEFGLAENLSIATNVLYMRKAVEVKNDENLVFDVWARYIEIPLYLKYSFGEKLKPHVFLGPTIGFLLNSEVDVDLFNLRFNGDFSTVLQNMDYGVLIGAGAEFPIWKGNLIVQGRYRYGFYDVLKGGAVELKAGQTLRETVDIDPGDNLYTSEIQIMVGYTLPLEF